jgi:hypothetical protein
MKLSPKTSAALQYICAAAMLICAAGMLSDQSYLGAFALTAGALVCMPVTRSLLEKASGKAMNPTLRYSIIVAAWLSIGIFAKPVPAEDKQSAVAKNTVDTTSKVKADTVPPPVAVAVIDTTPSLVSVPVDTTPVYAEATPVTPVDNTVATDNTSATDNTDAGNTSYSSSSTTTSTSKWKGYGKSKTSGTSGYTLGPRGGCYYINAKGKKVYVDHSYCN